MKEENKAAVAPEMLKLQEKEKKTDWTKKMVKMRKIGRRKGATQRVTNEGKILEQVKITIKRSIQCYDI